MLDAAPPHPLRALIEDAWRRARRRRVLWAAAVLALALGTALYFDLSGGGGNGSGSLFAGNAQRYTDAAGRWSIGYPPWMHLERSAAREAGDALVEPLFSEVTIASFRPKSGIESGQSAQATWVHFEPPLDKRGRFPSAGVAFRLSRVSFGPLYDTPSPIRETRFPVSLDRFAHGASVGRKGLAPRPRSYRVYADGQSFQADAWIGGKASPALKVAFARMVASLRFPHLRAGERGVLGPSGRYPLGAFVLLRKVAPHVYINLYIVHASGGFYAVRRRWLTDYRHKRIGCQVTFDPVSEQLFCRRPRIRWNRSGEVISQPRGMEHVGGVRFERVTIGWDGRLLLTGTDLRTRGVRALWQGGTR